MNSPTKRFLVALLLAWALPAGEPAPREAPPAAGPVPVARAARTSGPIVIDGALDEPAWGEAPPVASFTQRLPAEGSPATQPSEVRFLFDDENLYVGADLRDSEPGRIVAREMKEDGELPNDDLFGIVLDTFHDRRNAFYFEANPNGARGDALIYDEGRTQSFDWDGVWEVRSRITGSGWTVEMQIPFKTLHFNPAKTNPWGLQVWRLIRRNAEDAFWAPIPRNEDLFRISRAGELRGLEGIRQGKSVAVKPYALGDVGRRPTLGRPATEEDGEIGLDARFDVTPYLAAVLTVNTDFAETEVDDQQVNTTRFPLFFPEKREFFLEQTGYFEFGYNRTGPGAPPGLIPFFSRRIGLSSDNAPVSILGGVKLAGRMGRYNLGFLSVLADEDLATPRTNYSVFRLSRDILTRSNWGILGVGKEPSGPDDIGNPADPFDGVHSNRTYGADLNFSVLQNFKFGGSWLMTRTPGAAGGEEAGRAYAKWSNDTWDLEFAHRDIGASFNPEVGFVQRTGIEETEGFLGWSWRSDTAPVRRVEPHTRHVYTAGQDHELATRVQHWATTVEFRDGSEVEVGYNPLFDELDKTFVLDFGADDGDPSTPDDPADNVEVRRGAYHPTQWLVRYEGNPSRFLSGNAYVEFGDFFDGDFLAAELNAAARFSKYFRTTLGVKRTEISLPARAADPIDPIASPALPPRDFNFTLVQARLGVTFTTRLYFDTFLQYNTDLDDFSSNLRFNYKYRPGSDLYVVYNERRDVEGLPTDVVDRVLTVKWTYLLHF
jgi:hypothetical protein